MLYKYACKEDMVQSHKQIWECIMLHYPVLCLMCSDKEDDVCKQQRHTQINQHHRKP